MREAGALPKSPCVIKLPHPVNALALTAAWPDRYPFFLESTDGGVRNARYDILMCADEAWLSLDPTRGVSGRFQGLDTEAGFLENLDGWLKSEKKPGGHHGLPFNGGWFIYLGYELAHEIEPGLELPAAESGLPTALAVRCPAALLHDRSSGQWFLTAECSEVAEKVLEDLTSCPAHTVTDTGGFSAYLHDTGNEQAFVDAVGKIRDYIYAGDVFQVNLSRAWAARLPDTPVTDLQIYTQLRAANPAPFAGYMHWQDRTLFCSSPERLVEVRGPRVQTRPIAGTRPRSRESGQDASERDALVAHPKERAEHIMLIDLERNDLGRVCQPGTVEVDELMVLESYAHVHHIVSNVRGILREGITPGDVIRAVFPGGTITGCPKIRCMEIIAELEGEGRGYYTGAMGYLDRNGDMDLNILIRCMERDGNTLKFRTGAGIVADSVATSELNETRAKARGLLRALNIDG